MTTNCRKSVTSTESMPPSTVYTATLTSNTVMVISRYFGSKPQTVTRKSPPVRRNTPMLSSPPKTITTPLNQRIRFPKRISNSSGMVITPASRKGFTQKPVYPTKNMDRAASTPGTAPEKPFT
ncbi:MAG: hypothetical protein BWX80_04081 [Candidatus Hydrogenedentes bacterium ADurb.Bin101]|nr:MAG: hypothetical protein BWX80_04081 [Candidatus Hydrogenedentes bacterium ADurb.Bin101]